MKTEVLALLAVVIAGGCVADVPRRWFAGNCAVDGACPGRHPCIEGRCSVACSSDDECGEGAVCLAKKSCTPISYACSHGLCIDGNACSVDECNTKTGECRNTGVVAGSCDDGKFCTLGDECADGNSGPQCLTAVRTCDDGQPGTQDSCDEAAKACTHKGASAP